MNILSHIKSICWNLGKETATTGGNSCSYRCVSREIVLISLHSDRFIYSRFNLANITNKKNENRWVLSTLVTVIESDIYA